MKKKLFKKKNFMKKQSLFCHWGSYFTLTQLSLSTCSSNKKWTFKLCSLYLLILIQFPNGWKNRFGFKQTCREGNTLFLITFSRSNSACVFYKGASLFFWKLKFWYFIFKNIILHNLNKFFFTKSYFWAF